MRTILCFCLAEVDFRPGHSGLSTRAISLLSCVITVSHYLPWTNPCTAPPATDPSLKPYSNNQGTSNLYFYTLLAFNSLGMFGYSLFFSHLSTGCSFQISRHHFSHPSIFTPTLPQIPLIIPHPHVGCYCYPCSFEVPDALKTNRYPVPCNFSCVIHPSIECMLQKIRSPLSQVKLMPSWNWIFSTACRMLQNPLVYWISSFNQCFAAACSAGFTMITGLQYRSPQKEEDVFSKPTNSWIYSPHWLALSYRMVWEVGHLSMSIQVVVKQDYLGLSCLYRFVRFVAQF